MSNIEEFFRSVDPRRDNFLSRVFGIFNEEVVRGATTESGIESVTRTRGISDVLSIELMIADLRR